MKLTRAIAIAVIAGSMGVGAAVHAQSLKNVDQPNEYPPASYQGRQYVDSKGCVYIRAGVDGSVSWVPRMSRDRKVLCGFKPTQVTGTTKQQVAPKLGKNVRVLQAAKPEEGAPTARSQPKPAMARTAAKPTSKPVARTVAKPVARPVSKPKPRVIVAAPVTASKPRPMAKPKVTAAPQAKRPRRSLDQVPRRAGLSAPCRGGGATHNGLAVRCGPQAELPYTPGTGRPTAPAPVIRIERKGSSYMGATQGQIVRQGEVGPNVRVVPRHVYENRKFALVQAAPPEGYERVFDDGRLNPYRGEQTFGGKAAMDRVWQPGVPHRLRRGNAEARVVVSTQGVAAVSSKSAPERKALRLRGQGYVHVASYADYDAAQSAARRVQALGLPVRIGTYERKGVTRRMVLAGPFGDGRSAQGALAKARGAGFSGARLRK